MQDNSHMVTNPIKTKSMTMATRQKHQLSPLPLVLVLRGVKTDQVSEHSLLGVAIDNKLRWDSHTDNVCKTVSKRVFLLSKLRYIVDIDIRKLFLNAYMNASHRLRSVVRVQNLRESRGGRPGLSLLMSLMVSVDVKRH